jgi:hypothetical protein
MIEETTVYESPTLTEVGDFTDLTRITDKGQWSDVWGGWWDL